ADPKNKGGWRIIVAIADVAYYVPPGSALDKGAAARGNSVYLPDRVVPMLPERLSNGLCSLREGEDRPCLAVEMIFNKSGRKRGHKFLRAIMRSAVKLSYEEAQTAFDGAPCATAAPFAKDVLAPLYSAYKALVKAREARSPLDLDMPERRIVFKDGKVDGVKLRDRFDAHRLIEECMIQANVAAAETLEAARLPFIYRVHDEPDPEKLEAARDYLQSIGYPFAKGQVVTAKTFNEILAKAKERDESELAGLVVLRSQCQAVYTTDNAGHFGLNLRRYAHFTSPIRRYADLTVHRALIKACKLGSDGAKDIDAEALEETAQTISNFERRAMAAERDSVDRFMAAWLQDRVGAEFDARIAGVTRFGVFVRLEETGADGLIPIRTLGTEYYRHEEAVHALVGETTGRAYRLGQKVRVRLEEATPVAGGLVFDMLSPPGPAPKTRKSSGRKGRGRKDAGRKSGARKGKSRKGGASKRGRAPGGGKSRR
ncbi:MAG: VacB/RNase II family 3'-5' exoribonuclease, partial [Pseudomonadota bacterium]